MTWVATIEASGMGRTRPSTPKGRRCRGRGRHIIPFLPANSDGRKHKEQIEGLSKENKIICYAAKKNKTDQRRAQ